MEITKRSKGIVGAKRLHGAGGRAGRTVIAVSGSGEIVLVDRRTGRFVDKHGNPLPRTDKRATFVAVNPIQPGHRTVQVKDRRTGETELFQIRAPSKIGALLRKSKGRPIPVRRLITGETSQPDPATANAVRIADAVVRELTAKDPTGALLKVVADDPTDFAARVADHVDTAALWSEHLGPVYSAKSVRNILGVSKQAVNQNRGLLRMTTGDGTVVYPAYQFAGTSVVPGVAEIVKAASGLVSHWLLASWFVSPSEDLDGRTPISVLRARGEAPVVAAAHGWLGRLAS